METKYFRSLLIVESRDDLSSVGMVVFLATICESCLNDLNEIATLDVIQK